MQRSQDSLDPDGLRGFTEWGQHFPKCSSRIKGIVTDKFESTNKSERGSKSEVDFIELKFWVFGYLHFTWSLLPLLSQN